MLLLRRLPLAFIFLYHGWPKAMQPEMAMSKFEKIGFPGFLGPIVGWFTSFASLLERDLQVLVLLLLLLTFGPGRYSMDGKGEQTN